MSGSVFRDHDSSTDRASVTLGVSRTGLAAGAATAKWRDLLTVDSNPSSTGPSTPVTVRSYGPLSGSVGDQLNGQEVVLHSMVNGALSFKVKVMRLTVFSSGASLTTLPVT